eukprot:scaffold22596_cov131-Cylindrotheca_fusiformis.AAC.8
MSGVARTKRRLTRHIKDNKRLRRCTKITPWRDMWELESVGRALLTVFEPVESGAVMAVEEAFQTVAVWKARSNAMEGLPHAVESTFHLAHVYWRDNIDPNSSMSITELRLSYSSAIVRTINGFADTLQQQRFAASSVSLLCAQLGIPAWIVDIRHEASHNVLPTLSVLRLATSTLIAFLKNEFWIPTCPNWSDSDGENASSTTLSATNASEKDDTTLKAIDYLLEYKKRATAFFSSSSEEGASATSAQGQNAAKANVTKPGLTTLEFDPLFGDGSSDDDDDWEDPLLGNVWGSSIGTNSNRFALLEPPKGKPKAQAVEKTKKKPIVPPTQKKKAGEKYPIDYAKDFVTAISPQEGYATAVMFLVWGGIGGSPSGRGVLIPGSATSFPANTRGITKSWQRYSPLLQVLGRLWPGFCSCLLVHLVDFVVAIEESVVENQSLDAGSARKLFFLSSWIRFCLSQQFIATIDPEFVSKTSNKKNGPIELTLAERHYLEKLGYPLNALCDRCNQYTGDSDFRRTSHDVLQSIEEILGEKRVQFFGLGATTVCGPTATTVERPIEESANASPLQPKTDSTCEAQEAQQRLSSSTMGEAKMSLDEIERLLLDEEEPSKEAAAESTMAHDDGDLNKAGDLQEDFSAPAEYNKDAPYQPRTSSCSGDNLSNSISAWVRCPSWEPCSLGSLPGFPM